MCVTLHLPVSHDGPVHRRPWRPSRPLGHLTSGSPIASVSAADTFTGNILTSVNPCRSLPSLYSAKTMTSYAGRLLGGSHPPHLYAIAEETYRSLVKGHGNQGLVVSGVSGAGKTEANKIVMQYLCWRASHSAGQVGRHMVLSGTALADLVPTDLLLPLLSTFPHLRSPAFALFLTAQKWIKFPRGSAAPHCGFWTCLSGGPYCCWGCGPHCC